MPHVVGRLLSPASLAVLQILQAAQAAGEPGVPRKSIGPALAARGIGGAGRKCAGRGAFGNHTMWNLQALGFVLRIHVAHVPHWALTARGQEALALRGPDGSPPPVKPRRGAAGRRDRLAREVEMPASLQAAVPAEPAVRAVRIAYGSGHVSVPAGMRSVFEWAQAQV